MIVLLPVYRPTVHLAALAEALRGPELVVVDDGSGVAAAGPLRAVEDAGGTVLRESVHRGKGAALKAGLRYVAQRGQTVVTADGDGQHRVEDILRVGRHTDVTGRIALGVRTFGTGTPARSRVGNAATSLVFRAATGHRIGDTQTGLRGLPAALLPWLLEIPGDGFDYEMRMLLEAARAGHPLDEVPVATTYLDGNAGSHFGALGDSAAVYRPLLRALFRGTGAGQEGRKAPLLRRTTPWSGSDTP